MTTQTKSRTEELTAWAKSFEDSARLAAREAVLLHKKMGVPIVVMRDGKMVIVPPEEIVVDDEPNSNSRQAS